MRDDNGSGYKSTCANEKTVDEMGLPRMRELAYELSAKWAWAVGPGLGRILPGLAESGFGWHPSAGLGRAWDAHWAARLCRPWVLACCCAIRRSSCWPERKREEKRKEEKEKEKKRKREGRREIREGREKKRKRGKDLSARDFRVEISIIQCFKFFVLTRKITNLPF